MNMGIKDKGVISSDAVQEALLVLQKVEEERSRIGGEREEEALRVQKQKDDKLEREAQIIRDELNVQTEAELRLPEEINRLSEIEEILGRLDLALQDANISTISLDLLGKSRENLLIEKARIEQTVAEVKRVTEEGKPNWRSEVPILKEEFNRREILRAAAQEDPVAKSIILELKNKVAGSEDLEATKELENYLTSLKIMMQELSADNQKIIETWFDKFNLSELFTRIKSEGEERIDYFGKYDLSAIQEENDNQSSLYPTLRDLFISSGANVNTENKNGFSGKTVERLEFIVNVLENGISDVSVIATLKLLIEKGERLQNEKKGFFKNRQKWAFANFSDQVFSMFDSASHRSFHDSYNPFCFFRSIGLLKYSQEEIKDNKNEFIEKGVVDFLKKYLNETEQLCVRLKKLISDIKKIQESLYIVLEGEDGKKLKENQELFDNLAKLNRLMQKS